MDDAVAPVAKRPRAAAAPAADARGEAQLARLEDYKRKHGDCNVPQRCAEGSRLSPREDLPLGSWVSNQRQGKKKLDRGEPSAGMTAERVARLDALGFAWSGPISTSHFAWARALKDEAQGGVEVLPVWRCPHCDKSMVSVLAKNAKLWGNSSCPNCSPAKTGTKTKTNKNKKQKRDPKCEDCQLKSKNFGFEVW
jgi:hypothetical protein